MNSSAPSLARVLKVVDTLEPPGAPVTTPEVAAEFDCTDRTIYNKLEALVEVGSLETKKVGARGRVWWRPTHNGHGIGGSRSNPDSQSSHSEQSPLFHSDGEMAERIREFKWAETPIGPIDDWPSQLRVAVNIMLGAIEAIGVYWGDDRRLLYNDAAREQIGEKHPDALGRPARDVFPEAWDELGPIHDQVMAGDGPVRIEEHYLPLERAGELEDLWWDSSFNPIPTGDGSVGGVLNVSFDVTDRVRAEREISKAKERLDVALDAAEMGTWEWDLEARTVTADETMLALFDVPGTGDAVPVERFLKRMSSEGVKQCKAVMESAFEPGEELQDDIRLDHVDGPPRWVTWRGRATEDDPSRLRGVSFDVTERKQAELEHEAVREQLASDLLESERRYRTVLNSMDEGFFLADVVFDDDGEPLDVLYRDSNPAATEMTGEEFEGRWLTEIDPGYEEYWYELFGRVASTGEGERGVLYSGPDDIWADYYVFKPEGAPSRQVAIVFQDVTERKRAETELERQAELDAFRVELADAIRPLVDPIQVQQAAARVLGEQLNVTRANYCEFLSEDGRVMVHSEYLHDDTQTAIGEHHLDDFGQHILESLQAGDSVVIDDLRIDPTFTEEQRASYQKFGIQSLVAVPIIKEGQCTAYVVVNASTPREWTDTEVEMVEETAERTWEAVERAHAEQRLKASNQSLQRLNAVSREMIDADSATISNRVSEDVVDILDVEYAALWQYDEQAGDLNVSFEHAAPGTDLDAVRPSEVSREQVWETFIDDEIDVDDTLNNAATDSSPSRLGSQVFVPLGRHGVIIAASGDPETFEGRVLDLTKMVASTVEAAWDRAESEKELACQNEELTRLDRLNTLIRAIDQVLVEADTREAIDKAICERLASSDFYEFAWLATYDAATDTLRPQAWTGVDSHYLEERTVALEDTSSDDPLVATHRTQDMQVISDIATDARASGWREDALERGARSCITIPLVYQGSMYGILTVYGRTPQPDDRETDVLAELGETIAHAINAIESTTTRRTDSVVELTLRTRETTTPLARLARETDCTISVEGLVPNTAGEEFTVFFEATGVSPHDLLAASDQVLAIEDLDCLEAHEDEEGGLFRARLTESQLVSSLVTQEAVARSIAIEAGIVTIVADLPETEAVSEFLDECRQLLPDLELLGRTTRDRSLETQYSLRTSFNDRLTARQREVLQMAYESGFFESPRVQTGKDLSEALDISQSTFTYHLRESQRRLCEMVFDHA